MTTIDFDFPVWFNATPLKHRTPKMVRGIFRESFEVHEVEDDAVKPAMSLVVGDVTKEYVEIDGRFYVAIGESKSDAVKQKYSAENSPIPGVSTEHMEFEKLALEKARDSQLVLFPKQAPNSKGNYPRLSKDWFSETDLQWLEKRKERALAFLGNLRCAGGQIYEPLPEPMYVVNLATDRNDNAQSVSMEFRSSTAPPFCLGYPVAFFRADQGDEAVAYAAELAERHSVPVERAEKRDIVIHDSSSLSFSPYRQQILEAASLIMIHNQRHAAGDKALSSAIGSIIGYDVNVWRDADQGSFEEDALVQLEELVRKGLRNNRTEVPSILIEALLERWDERPISLSSSSPLWSLGHSTFR
ncbi:hypothetical protein OIU34_23335 [Pararhizobium sp. BT-229]|uniref:hypothetical protein n=1 Tax=Pararhizobium sp. BT-229 TaxID=2986923 RepID=UPI0021F7821D|nr:hypothetical protein [Pararhizobium sp. BT-229]MCV9964830.1 hypothetical protein [Pararhizobium sp. BT-229]